MYDKDKKENNYDFSYRTISKKFNMLFMPLNNEPLLVAYNIKTKKLKIK